MPSTVEVEKVQIQKSPASMQGFVYPFESTSESTHKLG